MTKILLTIFYSVGQNFLKIFFLEEILEKKIPAHRFFSAGIYTAIIMKGCNKILLYSITIFL